MIPWRYPNLKIGEVMMKWWLWIEHQKSWSLLHPTDWYIPNTSLIDWDILLYSNFHPLLCEISSVWSELWLMAFCFVYGLQTLPHCFSSLTQARMHRFWRSNVINYHYLRIVFIEFLVSCTFGVTRNWNFFHQHKPRLRINEGLSSSVLTNPSSSPHLEILIVWWSWTLHVPEHVLYLVLQHLSRCTLLRRLWMYQMIPQ